MWRELIRDLDPQSTFFPGATTLQLTALEGALSITLREELKSLLMESNGVRGEYELRLIWSAEEIVQRNLHMRTSAALRESYMPFVNLLSSPGIMKMIAVPGLHLHYGATSSGGSAVS